MQYKKIEINGRKIAYYESPGKGPVVVMVHGCAMSSLSWERQFESPLADNYRLIIIDLPGHGMSDKAAEPEKTYTLPGYAEIVVLFAKQLGLQNAVFVGWSLGGHIILEAAERLPASGLVTIGSTPIDAPSSIPAAFYPHPAFHWHLRHTGQRKI